MIKFLWYTYFVLFLIFTTVVSRTKAFILRKSSPEKADLYLYKQSQNIAKHILKVSKTQTETTGLENIPNVPCLFVSNHQAIFDAFLIVPNINNITGFIAKKEILKLPLIRSWLKDIHSVFIDRKNIREGVKAINKGIENLKDGYSMIIFPEGTRSLKSEMAEFKKGSMKLALKANVPIVPITVDGTYNVLEVGNKVRGHTLRMVVHKPIYPDTLSALDKKNLSIITHDIIENELININSQKKSPAY